MNDMVFAAPSVSQAVFRIAIAFGSMAGGFAAGAGAVAGVAAGWAMADTALVASAAASAAQMVMRVRVVICRSVLRLPRSGRRCGALLIESNRTATDRRVRRAVKTIKCERILREAGVP